AVLEQALAVGKGPGRGETRPGALSPFPRYRLHPGLPAEPGPIRCRLQSHRAAALDIGLHDWQAKGSIFRVREKWRPDNSLGCRCHLVVGASPLEEESVQCARCALLVILASIARSIQSELATPHWTKWRQP